MKCPELKLCFSNLRKLNFLKTIHNALLNTRCQKYLCLIELEEVDKEIFYLSSAQVRLVIRGLAGPDTSVFRESCSDGEPSFFHVKAFSQIR